MASEKGLTPEAKQRSERFAAILKTFRQQTIHPSFAAAGIPAPCLSKRQLSAVLGISATILSKYEDAEIDPWEIRFGVILQIAQLMQLDIGELQRYLSGQSRATPQWMPLTEEQRLRI